MAIKDELLREIGHKLKNEDRPPGLLLQVVPSRGTSQEQWEEEIQREGRVVTEDTGRGLPLKVERLGWEEAQKKLSEYEKAENSGGVRL